MIEEKISWMVWWGAGGAGWGRGHYLLPLQHDRLRQRVVAALLVGKVLQVIQLSLELHDQVLLLLPLGLQALPLLPLTLWMTHRHAHTHFQPLLEH